MTSGGQIIPSAHQWLSKALETIDGDVLLTSPYLTTRVCRLIADSLAKSQFPGVVITALDPSAVAGGYLMIQGLRDLLKAGIEVREVDRLHAKCFIVGSQAMLGSANLTGTGLGLADKSNRELGVTLDASGREKAHQEIVSWPARTITPHDLDELLTQAKSLSCPSKPADSDLTPELASKQAEKLLIDARDTDRKLWLKLEYGKPALEGWRQPSYFASPKKGKPSFKPGDLVFICAKDTQECYAVVEVTSEPEEKPADYIAAVDQSNVKRWPWINRTMPRLVPDHLVKLTREELGVKGGGLQNGHVSLKFDQFTAGVRALARLATK